MSRHAIDGSMPEVSHPLDFAKSKNSPVLQPISRTFVFSVKSPERALMTSPGFLSSKGRLDHFSELDPCEYNRRAVSSGTIFCENHDLQFWHFHNSGVNSILIR